MKAAFYRCISIVRLFQISGKKFMDLVVTNWMHVPVVRMVSKPKIRGCPNVRIGVGELVGADLEKSDY